MRASLSFCPGRPETGFTYVVSSEFMALVMADW